MLNRPTYLKEIANLDAQLVAFRILLPFERHRGCNFGSKLTK